MRQKKLKFLFGLLVFLISFTASANSNNNNLISDFKTEAPNLNPKVLALALKAYDKAQQQGVSQSNLLTVIDYSLPSTEKRLWVLDLNRKKVEFNSLVAHGKNSGKVYATHFSNRPQSEETSLGLYLTEGTYQGKKGTDLTLRGLEPGFNDNAKRRAVVMHGAAYVSDEFAKRGYIGRSWGCPSLPLNMVKPIINTIKGGSLVFAYAPEPSWLEHSKYLQ